MRTLSPDTSSTRTTTPAPPALDPGQEVPAEYDVFCEVCGYSLLGIAGDRCPECGATYDPEGLPFARVPWLHRQRLGRLRAYWATVWMVLWRPRRFAEELCRPVRVSAADARAFRALTIRIAAFSVALTAAAILAIVVPSLPGGPLPRGWWVALAGFVALAFVSTTVFLVLATDMPTFIWRGLPAKPDTLAPAHHYASAPLALMPLLAAAAVVLTRVFVRPPSESVLLASQIGLGVCVAAMLLISWRSALQLMAGATGGNWRGVRLLGLYLPVHWLAMAFMVGMLSSGVMMGVNLAVEMWRA